MVDVVQLVEHQVVILGVAGSSPVIHPDENISPGLAPGDFSLLRLPGQDLDVQVLLHEVDYCLHQEE